jgi:hypothetical protein
MPYAAQSASREAGRQRQKMINRLALAPLRTCRTLHECVLCAQPITLGQQFRDRGYGARAHEGCFKGAAAARSGKDQSQ